MSADKAPIAPKPHYVLWCIFGGIIITVIDIFPTLQRHPWSGSIKEVTAQAKPYGLPGDMSLFTYMKKYGQKKMLHQERGGLTIWNIAGIHILVPG